ncbi:MAG: OFA family MFS transporter, partial [Actinobacteria bacterium]
MSARAWVVTLAGLGINLALGVLYSWSVVAKTLTKPVAEGGWAWSAGQASLPYAVGVGVFAITMVFAGRLQDRLGPRLVATIGGALCGIGLVVASFGSAANALPLVLGFGLLTGTGIGFGYAAATPAAVKWFPPSKKGLVTGLVVAGFGLASVYIAPLTTYLLHAQGVANTFRVLGVVFVVVTVALAQLLVNPPAGYVAVESAPAGGKAPAGAPRDDYSWSEMVRTRQFVLLWIMYAFSAFAGLMIIGHMAKIAALQISGLDLGFILVA